MPVLGTITRDQNRIPSWWGISSVDGVSLIPIAVDSATGRAKMEIGTSVSAVMANLNGSFPREENRIPCIGGQSNANSSVIIPVSVNPSTGAILAQTA